MFCRNHFEENNNHTIFKNFHSFSPFPSTVHRIVWYHDKLIGTKQVLGDPYKKSVLTRHTHTKYNIEPFEFFNRPKYQITKTETSITYVGEHGSFFDEKKIVSRSLPNVFFVFVCEILVTVKCIVGSWCWC